MQPRPQRVPQPDDVAQHPRLTSAIEEYLEELEAGTQPNRQEYLARYPDIADDLDTCLEGLEFIYKAAPNLSVNLAQSAASSTNISFRPLATLGDYQITREIGRGGMGIVYEAQQLSIGRPVALKVLPFAAVLDKKQLQRFKNESIAAGTLDHSNIVPVYSVGCERGVHYYAMRLIDGQSLADSIAQLQEQRAAQRSNSAREDPAPAVEHRDTLALANLSTKAKGSTNEREYVRTVAELGLQAAGALKHAHDVGLIHRDVKPSNLLLDTDGQLWLTDFGLAHMPGDSSLTVTGDILGTLRYMSPEQAEGNTPLDHRTDIYSLGLTLYELCALKPPFVSDNRQRLLKQIVEEQPVSLRNIDGSIPTDLETVVMKAMAKNPADRYTTAGELADDLRRFLADQPIQAKPPSTLDRAAKWARRHRPVVWSTLAFLILALITLSVSSVFLFKTRRDAQLARKQAEFNLNQANRNLGIAQSSTRRAEDNLRLARSVVRKVFVREADRLRQLHLPEAERELLNQAVEFYESLPKLETASPEIRAETAQAYSLLGDMHLQLDEYQKSREAYAKAIRLFENLHAEHPRHTGTRVDLSYAYHGLASLHAFAGESHAALIASMRAHQLLVHSSNNDEKPLRVNDKTPEELGAIAQQLASRDSSTDPLQMGNSLLQLGISLHDYSIKAAPRILRLAIGHASRSADKELLADIHAQLGHTLLKLRKFKKGEASLNTAISIYEPLIVESPHDLNVLSSLVDCFESLAAFKDGRGEPRDAAAMYRKAIAVQTKLARQYHDVASHQETLANLHFNLAKTHGQLKETEHATRAYQDSLALLNRLVKQTPEINEYRLVRARAYYNLATTVQATAADEAHDYYSASLSDWRALAARSPDVSEYHSRIGATLHNMGMLQRESGDNHELQQLFSEALERQRRALRCEPVYDYAREFLDSHYQQLAKTFMNARDYGQATTLIEQWQNDASDAKCAKAVEVLSDWAWRAINDEQLTEEKRAELIGAYISQARRLIEHAINSASPNAEDICALSWTLLTTPVSELSDFKTAVTLAERSVSADTENTDYWNTLGVAHFRAGNISAAAEALQHVISLDNEWSRQLGTDTTDFSRGVSADRMGNVYISGWTTGSLGTHVGNRDAFVCKYDTTGTLRWIQQLGTRKDDRSRGVSADGLGSIYITGITGGNLGGPNAGGNDAFISKYDASGTLKWIRQLGTSSNDESRGASADGHGNVYISGWTDGSLDTNAGGRDAFISKYDAGGTLQWTKQLGTSGVDESWAVSADGQGNVYISGATDGNLGETNAGDFDAFLSKYDARGTLKWTRQLGTNRRDESRGVRADGQDSVYIAGVTEGSLHGTNAGAWDMFVSKYDGEGTLQWTRQLGSSGVDECWAVSADGLGNVYISGGTGGNLGKTNAGGIDAFLSKYNALGAHQWMRQLGTNDRDESRGVSADRLGNVYISGVTHASLGGRFVGGRDAFVAKFTDVSTKTDHDGDGDVDGDDVAALVGEIVDRRDTVRSLSTGNASLNGREFDQSPIEETTVNGFTSPIPARDAKQTPIGEDNR